MKKSIKVLVAFIAGAMVGMSPLKAETATIVSPSNGHLYQEWEEHRTRRIHSTKIPLEITGDIITEDVNNPPVSYEVGWCWLYGEDFLSDTFDPGTLNCSTEEIVSEGVSLPTSGTVKLATLNLPNLDLPSVHIVIRLTVTHQDNSISYATSLVMVVPHVRPLTLDFRTERDIRYEYTYGKYLVNLDNDP